MPHSLPASAAKVQAALHSLGLTCEVIELPNSTRTAREAAAAVGCEVAQIVKSLVFKGADTQRPILVLDSGVNRVNEKRLSEIIGEAVQKADDDFVREATGGTCTPQSKHLSTEDLLQFDEIWAAAGTQHAVFRLKPSDLREMAGGEVVCMK